MNPEEFLATTATEAEIRAWNRFTNRIQQELMPEDPPVTERQTRESLTSTPAHVRIRRWGVWQGDQVVGRAWLQVMEAAENRHCAWFGVQVDAEWRRRGLGTRLLAPVVETAEVWSRTLLLGGSSDLIPAGEQYMRRLEARPALHLTSNQLRLEELDRNLLARWKERFDPEAQGFEVGAWEGPYPEAFFPDAIAMKAAVNLMPRGDLEVEDVHLTPDQLREHNHWLQKTRIERWTLFLRDRSTGRVAGYTELYWHPDRPEILDQDDTAVFPEYQNRGMGRWLKAAMLERVLERRPQVKRVRTGNANSNAPMLKINHELGFRPHHTHTEWQVQTAVVRKYLSERGVK